MIYRADFQAVLVSILVGKHEQTQAAEDFVPNPPEGADLLVSGSLGRIVETPMKRCRTRKDRTCFLRTVANCDDIVEALTTENAYILGRMGGKIDADFAHRFNRQRMDSFG